MIYEVRLRMYVDAGSFESADRRARETIEELVKQNEYALDIRDTATGQQQTLTAETASARKKANDG